MKGLGPFIKTREPSRQERPLVDEVGFPNKHEDDKKDMIDKEDAMNDFMGQNLHEEMQEEPPLKSQRPSRHEYGGRPRSMYVLVYLMELVCHNCQPFHCSSIYKHGIGQAMQYCMISFE